jgi:hypothetical protein
MRYLIKSQRDGWYFSGFEKTTGLGNYGKIQDAKIYDDKYTALKDLKRMEPCGQRIIAVTRMGENRVKGADKLQVKI